MTQKAKHTPGPWEADLKRHNGHCGISINAPDDIQVATVYLNIINSEWKHPIVRPQNNESVNNARLIAAAPEMYEALKILITKTKQLERFDMESYEVEQAKLAINKAEGK